MSSAAVDWANKRKAMVARAEQLRAERKAGKVDDNYTGAPRQAGRPAYLEEAHSFAPAINKRPGYLNDSRDSLDNLAAAAAQPMRNNPNDIFEQPLAANRKTAAPLSGSAYVSEQAPKTYSPSSDALGTEMRKFQSNPNGSSNRSSNGGGGTNAPLTGHSQGPYRSKFMQQYENGANGGGGANNGGGGGGGGGGEPLTPMSRAQKADAEAEAIFLASLRGGGGDDGGARSGKKAPASASKKPSWNDNTDSVGAFGGGFGDPPPVASRSVGPRKTRAAPVGDIASAMSGISPQLEPPRVTHRSAASGRQMQSEYVQPEWNAHVDPADPFAFPANRRAGGGGDVVNGGDGGGGGGRPVSKTTPRITHDVSPRITPRVTEKEPQVAAARSRLSLLKTKMRQSESSNGSRRSLANSADNDEDMDYSEGGGGGGYNLPKTAPSARRGGGGGDRSARDEGDDGNGGGYSSGRRHEQQQQHQPQAPPSRTTAAPSRVQQQQRQQRPAYDDDDDDEDNDHGVYTIGKGQQQQQPQGGGPKKLQQQHQQQQQQQQQRQQQQPSEHPQEYPSGMDDGDGGGGGGADQMECPDCGRRFNFGPYQKHIKICAKVFVQKRKPFDAKLMRVGDNPELVQILKKTQMKEKQMTRQQHQQQQQQQQALPPRAAAAATLRAGGGGGGGGSAFGRNDEDYMVGGGSSSRQPPQKSRPAASSLDDGGGGSGKSAKWKEQSNAFRDAMKAARQVSKAIATGAPLPPPTYSAPDPSMLECPTCGRRFSQKAGERHIPQCANIQAKPKRLNAHSGQIATSGAIKNAKPSMRGKF